MTCVLRPSPNPCGESELCLHLKEEIVHASRVMYNTCCFPEMYVRFVWNFICVSKTVIKKKKSFCLIATFGAGRRRGEGEGGEKGGGGGGLGGPWWLTNHPCL